MRTSRVTGTHSSVYRNATRKVLSDTHFADAINSGMHDHFRQSREQQNKRHTKKNSHIPKPKKLVQNKARLIVKGMQFNSNSVKTLNQLIHCSTRANAMNKLQRRITTYRTSI
ncbi:hypothetical protein MKZ17_01895 [Solibacillus sp. FSL R7-0682]|uniref:hypothetical protein n=1 Tax=Solibacillus sp. FSL R7-0682 TaxID=2921690 RepID=UPI0030F4D91A